MKKLLALLLLSTALLRADRWDGKGYAERGPTFLPSGEIDHFSGVRVTVIQVSTTGLVLECVNPSMIYFGSKPKAANDIPWREFYVIVGGKLKLDHIQEPVKTVVRQEFNFTFDAARNQPEKP